MAATDPAIALAHWRAVREQLYREHPQSPVPADARADVPGAPFRPRPEPPLRGRGRARAAARARARSRSSCPTAARDTLVVQPRRPDRDPVRRAARGRCRCSGWPATRAACSSRSATRRTARRRTAPGATSSMPPRAPTSAATRRAGTLIVDFNFAFQPSCAFDPRWACPLAPPENRLDIADPRRRASRPPESGARPVPTGP